MSASVNALPKHTPELIGVGDLVKERGPRPRHIMRVDGLWPIVGSPSGEHVLLGSDPAVCIMRDYAFLSKTLYRVAAEPVVPGDMILDEDGPKLVVSICSGCVELDCPDSEGKHTQTIDEEKFWSKVRRLGSKAQWLRWTGRDPR